VPDEGCDVPPRRTDQRAVASEVSGIGDLRQTFAAAENVAAENVAAEIVTA
jgi:hypothetical protein